jgi:signal recognition particle subunit SRP9
MYLEDWDTFAQQAEALYRSDPLRTRYCTKYIHTDGQLVLKVTDDRTVRRRTP